MSKKQANRYIRNPLNLHSLDCSTMQTSISAWAGTSWRKLAEAGMSTMSQQKKRQNGLLVLSTDTLKKNRLPSYHLLPSKTEQIRMRLMSCSYSNSEGENTLSRFRKSKVKLCQQLSEMIQMICFREVCLKCDVWSMREQQITLLMDCRLIQKCQTFSECE